MFRENIDIPFINESIVIHGSLRESYFILKILRSWPRIIISCSLLPWLFIFDHFPSLSFEFDFHLKRTLFQKHFEN